MLSTLVKPSFSLMLALCPCMNEILNPPVGVNVGYAVLDS